MGNFEIYNAKLGSRFFVHYDGALRECKLIGYDFTLYGASTKVYVYMGKNATCVPIEWYNTLYPTIEDALCPNESSRKAVPLITITDDYFTKAFLKGKGVRYKSSGSNIVGWLWDGSQAKCYSPREHVTKIKVRLVNDEIVTTFIGYNNEEIVFPSKWYQSAEECCNANKPTIIMLDDSEERVEECTINITIKCNAKDKANVLDKIDSIKLNYSIE